MEATGMPARQGSALVLDMLARRIPLTLLPDLAWPETLRDDPPPAHSGCSIHDGRDAHPGRHAGGAGRQESLQEALAYAACPSGRHRRAPAVCGSGTTAS
jgi:hypothetical protein